MAGPRHSGLGFAASLVLLLAVMAAVFVLGTVGDTVVLQRFPVSIGSTDRLDPAVDRNIVVWSEEDGGSSRTVIRGKNLRTGAAFQITAPR